MRSRNEGASRHSENLGSKMGRPSMIARAFSFQGKSGSIDGEDAMPKTKNLANKRKPGSAKKTSSRVALTPEQLARLAAFRAAVKFQQNQWSQMSAEEKRQAEAKWELVKNTMNADRAGYRK